MNQRRDSKTPDILAPSHDEDAGIESMIKSMKESIRRSEEEQEEKLKRQSTIYHNTEQWIADHFYDRGCTIQEMRLVIDMLRRNILASECESWKFLYQEIFCVLASDRFMRQILRRRRHEHDEEADIARRMMNACMKIVTILEKEAQ